MHAPALLVGLAAVCARIPVRALIAALICLGMLSDARADQAMNEALVPVADSSETERVKAFSSALAQVFAKWSGQRLPSGSGVGAELKRAPELVAQYRYRRAKGSAGRSLWVRFDAEGVEAAVRRAGIPVWSTQRPTALLWVALGDGKQVDLVAPDSESGLDREIMDAAWKRGLPLRFPLLDLEDRIRVKPQDVRDLDQAVLSEASRRYPAGPVVGVRVEPEQADTWKADWRMLDAGRSETWHSGGGSPGAALAAGVDELADRLVARHALASTEIEVVEITVMGIRALADYGRLMTYLAGLGGVSEVSVLETRGESMLFRMRVAGGADGLRRIVSLGQVLKVDGSGYRLAP